MRRRCAVFALLGVGCLRDASGPDLGACAEYPDRTYTYGEVDIGTCLAGPADVQFLERDGRTWLVVSNADPFLNFTTGSVLLIDWDSVDVERALNPVDALTAYAQPTPRFVGGFGILEDRDLLLVTNRLSEEAVTRSDLDQGYVIDVSDPTRPHPWAPQSRVAMMDDPYLVALDPTDPIAYVGNLTDHSITLFDVGGGEIAPIDIAPANRIGQPVFVDVDASGSLATLDDLEIVDADAADPDLWTLTFVDKLVRLWVPTPEDTGDLANGLVRWTSGTVDFVPSSLGLEIDPSADPTFGTVQDPFVVVDANGLLVLFFEENGVLVALQSAGPAGDWSAGANAIFGGQGDWDAQVSGPSLVGISPTTSALFYDGRGSGVDDASIGVALTEDGLTYVGQGPPVLSAPGRSLEQPFVVGDAIANRFRMWLSVWDGDRWSVGLSESDDGLSWSDVVEVEGLDGTHVAAPTVAYVNGRYLMWYTTGAGDRWSHATAWSYDGHRWFDPTVVLDSEVAFALEAPPRLATQVDASNTWRMEGRDEGVIPFPIVAGARFPIVGQGLAFTLATGQEIDNGLLPDNRSIGGMQAGSAAEVDGRTVLYVTATGLDGRRRIAAVAPSGGGWSFLETDLIPAGTGGNVSGVSDPVVVGLDGSYVMFYAAEDSAGGTRVRRATSSDGRSFQPVAGDVIVNDDEWDDAAQAPHAVERLPSGDLRLWYGGFDGSRWAVGAAIGANPLGDFQADPGAFDPFQLGPGTPGSFDDSGVKDPMVFVADGETQMYYAGFDGLTWHVGHAIRQGDAWIRRTDPRTGLSIPAMSGLLGSFSAQGVDDPVVATVDGETKVWHSGFDGVRHHVGEALPRGAVLYPAPRFPTPGDRLQVDVEPGGPTLSHIELAQVVTEFATSGIGMSSMTLDLERGFLYVTSKLANFVYVLDIRDDTSGILDDANYRDIEQLISIETDLTPIGFRDAVIDPIRDRLYLSSVNPEGVVVVDLNDIVDDDRKDVSYEASMFALPLLDARQDEGVSTAASIGGDKMALTDDARLLLVPHLRANTLFVFDLEIGAFGELVGVLPNIGENPHLVRISPDGRFAVVANYLGDVDPDQGTVSSTLAVVDIDPTSARYLEIVTWIVNK